MKEKIKSILKIILIIVISSSISVAANTLINSNEVVYDNTKSGLESTTVQGAVDELYSAATNYSSVIQRLQALEENKFLDSHPVGSIYLTISENENTVTKMHNLYGGEWESYGQGRTLVGVGTGTDSNGTVKVFNKNEALGEYNHTLTVSEMPSHTHTTTVFSNAKTFSENGLTELWITGGQSLATAYGDSKNFSSAGESSSHNNIQPYITVYMYKRVN